MSKLVRKNLVECVAVLGLVAYDSTLHAAAGIKD
jgi:hypothetical protein